MKRALDIFASLLGILLLSPLFAILAVAIKIDSRGPVLYRARRVGKDGQVFHLFKFRSMVINADKGGPGITLADDRRITPIGKVLRHYRIDELPQLVNVLIGEMSLVGPRPEDPKYVEYYTPEQRKVLQIRPGITSEASLKFKNESELLVGDDWESRYIETIMPMKLAIELNYLKKRSFRRDLGIIARTLAAVSIPRTFERTIPAQSPSSHS